MVRFSSLVDIRKIALDTIEILMVDSSSLKHLDTSFVKEAHTKMGKIIFVATNLITRVRLPGLRSL
jgi:uncharacterized protein YacL